VTKYVDLRKIRLTMPPIGLDQALDKGTDHVEGVEVSDIEMAADLIKRNNNSLVNNRVI
jgi:hypothetical protein